MKFTKEQKLLRDCVIIQSMSRKGTCLDNSPTENFFGRLREEMFYGQEWRYETISELKVQLIDGLDTTITLEL